MYVGVDEAGRGPVLGPLVVAGVHGDPRDLPDGVQDSKTLSPERRRALADAIHENDGLVVACRIVPAAEINDAMADGQTLDQIETDAFAHVLAQLGASRAIVDTVGADTDAFSAELGARLPHACDVSAEAKADETDPLVGAASIVAKVQRDERLRSLAEEVGEPIGSGYPSDPTTRAFLVGWRKRHTDPPRFARTAWSTLDKLGFGTRTLTDFTTGGSQ